MADRFEELRNAAEQGTLTASDLQKEEVIVPPPVQEQPEQEQPQVPTSAADRELKRANTLNVILLVMVFIMIGLFAFLFFTDRLIVGVANPFAKDAVLIEKEDQSLEEIELTQEDEVVTQKEYLDSEMGVKFSYPNDWVVLSEQKEEGSLLVRVGDKTVNPDFAFEYYLPAGSGPTICIYPDTTNLENADRGVTFTNFTTIKEGELRRSFVEENSTYKVCMKGMDDLYYSDWIKPGYMTYHVNINATNSEEMLKVLDSIVLSYEYTGDMEF